MNMKTPFVPIESLFGVELLLACRARGMSAAAIELLQHRKGLEREVPIGGRFAQFHLNRLRELAAQFISPNVQTSTDASCCNGS